MLVSGGVMGSGRDEKFQGFGSDSLQPRDWDGLGGKRGGMGWDGWFHDIYREDEDRGLGGEGERGEGRGGLKSLILLIGSCGAGYY